MLPVSGTLTTPGKNSPRADAVLTAPEGGLPVMFVEVDNGTESPLALAHKAGRYCEFFRRTVKPPSPSPNSHAQTGKPVPMWETLYGPLGREGYPPLVIVFTQQVGPATTGSAASCAWLRRIGRASTASSPPATDRANATVTPTTPTPCRSWSPPLTGCASTGPWAGSGSASATPPGRPSLRPSTTPMMPASTGAASASATNSASTSASASARR
ncbi:replication-relaxation family protein [Streptomyces glebosus]|uniref:replication-relaxation family protein n=1 Tax=Streptomyces glebosus TaxID=249580 RepID=UPI00167F02CE